MENNHTISEQELERAIIKVYAKLEAMSKEEFRALMDKTMSEPQAKTDDETEQLRAECVLYKATLHWIHMNSGIAGDGNHIDPIQAHKDNVARIRMALDG